MVAGESLREEVWAERTAAAAAAGGVGAGVPNHAGWVVGSAATPGDGVDDHVPGGLVWLQGLAQVLPLSDADDVVDLVERVGASGLVSELQGLHPAFPGVFLMLRDRI